MPAHQDGHARNVVAQLHKSIVLLVHLRLGLEMTSMHLERSTEAIRESRQLLSQLRTASNPTPPRTFR